MLKHVTICWIGDPTPEKVIAQLKDHASPVNADEVENAGLTPKTLGVVENQPAMMMIEFRVETFAVAWRIYREANSILELMCSNYTANVKTGIGLAGSDDFIWTAARYEIALRDVLKQIKRRKYSAATIRRTLENSLASAHIRRRYET